MASLLGGVRRPARPRAKAPVPLVGRTATGASTWFNRRDALGELDTMPTNGTVFGIVNRTSTAVAEIEWKLYRPAKSGKEEDRVLITQHAALDILREPNPFMSGMELFEIGQQHLDLTGEAFWVVTRDKRFKVPLELWPVRPDRMNPVPDPYEYLAGWIYTAPDGVRVPLRNEDVIQVRMPHPTEPYRGLGPVQAVLTEIRGAQYAAEWSMNFFRNSALPGGIVQIEKRLSDTEFDEMCLRWDEQHAGVARAHHVAFLEQGAQWVDRKYSMRDMEFTDLRGVNRDAIMEGFGFPRGMLGITDDVNKANGESGERVFARWLTVPRANRWKNAIQTKLLPLFGENRHTAEIDYDSPVPQDDAAENAERTSKAAAVAALVNVGFDGNSAAKAYELPDGLEWHEPAKPEPPQPPAASDQAGPTPAEPDAPTPPAPDKPLPAEGGVGNLLAQLLLEHTTRAPRDADLPDPVDGWPESDVDAVDGIDLAGLQTAWTAALAGLLETWQTSVVAQWIRQLIDAVKDILSNDDRTGLASIELPVDDAVTTLSSAMAAFGETAAGHAVDEATASDVTLEPHWPTAADLEDAARQVAEFEARRYSLIAGREAARVAGPEPDVDVVGDHLDQFLTELSDAGARSALGGALTDAQNLARADPFSRGPVGALYASEQMDSNTCAPCRAVHGRWICTTDDLAPLFKLYPVGGYIDCLGKWRCRGTVVGVWRPETTKGGQ